MYLAITNNLNVMSTDPLPQFVRKNNYCSAVSLADTLYKGVPSNAVVAFRSTTFFWEGYYLMNRLENLLRDVCPHSTSINLVETTSTPAGIIGTYKVDGELYRAFYLVSDNLRLHPEYATNLYIVELHKKELRKLVETR